MNAELGEFTPRNVSWTKHALVRTGIVSLGISFQKDIEFVFGNRNRVVLDNRQIDVLKKWYFTK